MTLSEAIRRGDLGRKAKRRLFDLKNGTLSACCALGAAILGVFGKRYAEIHQPEIMYRDIGRVPFRTKTGDIFYMNTPMREICLCEDEEAVKDWLWRKNDRSAATVNQIADMLESLGL